ncbi:HD-GYP domain-containing protein [Desulfohalovibrio reitneri]|uniref:HD-GYP domain-containing protein n=1 Tax=Desulfohalovibrio reitneri TaxID=1307759 RepID=UPI0004A77321|nr:HD domain-containing phosphohydrolase [Desulfohalovibrio reitneri]
MAEYSIPEYRVSVDQLEPGVFIRLERMGWFDHPFLFNSFKIKNQEQIDILRSLGLNEVICVPEKSDRLPGRKPAGTEVRNKQASAPTPESAEVLDALWREKKARREKLQDKRDRLGKCEEQYVGSLAKVGDMMQGIAAGRPESVEQAAAFVAELTEFFLRDEETTLHLINVMEQTERLYYHSMNTAVLGLMLGRKAGLDAKAMNTLGMSALFHDIGKNRIEKKILRKRGPLTNAERAVVERHPSMGVDMLKRIGTFPPEALEAVYQHHEYMDGSGYPEGLSGETISRNSRILAIVNLYDNHCNHPDPLSSYTPYQALSHMFTQQAGLFDKEMLALFIRCLGVYPPGTVVQLSNGTIGIVVSVNAEDQLNPQVLLYDPDIPKREALFIDLAEEGDLKIEKSIRLNNLPAEILDYLSLRSRITYYVDQDGRMPGS